MPPVVDREWKLRPEILLSKQIPMPMHGLAPRVVLGSEWWDRTRRAAYASTNWHCQACGIHGERAKFRRWLEGHELYAIDYTRGRMTYVETVPLCHACHNYVHDGRMQSLVANGKLEQAKYARIIQHGDRVLKAAGLNPFDRLIQPKPPYAKWEDWRLVVDGKEYPPVYSSIDEWAKAFGVQRS